MSATADTVALSITTSNRVYTTPHHNYYVDTLQRDKLGHRVKLTPNSRHVYGDAADISVPDSANWGNLSNYAYKLGPTQPCREPWSLSHTHLHLDLRTDPRAVLRSPSCPPEYVIPEPK
jgi:hypothetical protein